MAESVGAPDGSTPWRAPGAVLLEARGITKRYRRHTVLDGVDLTVRAGQVAAVVGANGSGKSTFLRICAGLTSPDRGTVRVHGTLGSGPQDSGTCEYLVPDEHFVLIGTGRGLDRAASRAQGRDLAGALGWRPERRQARHLLEGTLVLLVVVGLQMIMDPSGQATKLLPFWFDREIATYAIDHTGAGYLLRGLLQAAVAATLLLAPVASASSVRLRRRPHLQFTSMP